MRRLLRRIPRPLVIVAAVVASFVSFELLAASVVAHPPAPYARYFAQGVGFGAFAVAGWIHLRRTRPQAILPPPLPVACPYCGRLAYGEAPAYCPQCGNTWAIR